MSALNDAIEQLEFALAKYPGSTAEEFRARRLVLRKAMGAYGQTCYGDGHHDGMRDTLDSQYAANAAAQAEQEADDDD